MLFRSTVSPINWGELEVFRGGGFTPEKLVEYLNHTNQNLSILQKTSVARNSSPEKTKSDENDIEDVKIDLLEREHRSLDESLSRCLTIVSVINSLQLLSVQYPQSMERKNVGALEEQQNSSHDFTVRRLH